MVLFPNAKINLGLNIINRRHDGFHDLETVFIPIRLCDILEVTAEQGTEPGLIFKMSGLAIPEGANLCEKAWQIFSNEFPQQTRSSLVSIHLHKVIPYGSGLGGGSSDAAHTLLALNSLFHTEVSRNKLEKMALELGSDCPFFIYNQPVSAQGKGEVFEPITLNLKGASLLVVIPAEKVNTAWAYGQIQPKQSPFGPAAIVTLPIEQWKVKLINDFEKPVFSSFPHFTHIKSHLYEMGAIYASMSGSGSTFYGLFAFAPQIPTGIFPKEYFVKTIAL